MVVIINNDILCVSINTFSIELFTITKYSQNATYITHSPHAVQNRNIMSLLVFQLHLYFKGIPLFIELNFLNVTFYEQFNSTNKRVTLPTKGNPAESPLSEEPVRCTNRINLNSMNKYTEKTHCYELKFSPRPHPTDVTQMNKRSACVQE